MDAAVERFRTALDAFVRGDLASVQDAFSPTVRAIWGGDSPYSGEYNGVGAAIALLAHTKDWFDPTTITVESITPAGDGIVVVESVTMHDELSGDRVEGVRFRLTVRFDEHGRISYIENEPEDAEAVDAFLNREHARRNPAP